MYYTHEQKGEMPNIEAPPQSGRSSRPPDLDLDFRFFPPILGVKFVEKLGFPNIFGSGKKNFKGFLASNYDFFQIKKMQK